MEYLRLGEFKSFAQVTQVVTEASSEPSQFDCEVSALRHFATQPATPPPEEGEDVGVESRAVTCRSHTSKQCRAGADMGLLGATYSASGRAPHGKRHCESPGTGSALLQVHFPDGGRGQLRPGSCWSLALAKQQRNLHLEHQPIQRPSAP